MTGTDRRQEGAIRSRLGERGIRYTAARRAVVEALQRGNGPQSVAELTDSLQRKVPLSSLYRTVSVLEGAEILTPHHGATGVTRYELAEWLSGHHHHLVCRDCGAIEDVQLETARERRLDDLVSEVAGESGFVARAHSLEIEGICRECSS